MYTLNNFKIRIFIIVLFPLLLSCSSQREEWEIEVEGKISQLNEGLEVTNIDLNSVDKSTIDPDFILNPNSTSHKFPLGAPKDFISIDDNLFLLDQAQNSIMQFDQAGHISKQINMEGKGPGELTRPNTLATNGEFIFIYDYGNGKVQQYNRNFESISSLTASPKAFLRSLSTSDSTLYLVDSIINYTESNLISTYNIYPKLGKKKISLLPRLLPHGHQPAVVNTPSFDANSTGYLVAGYTSLPRLFLFNPNGELIQSIKFSGKPVEKVSGYNKEKDSNNIGLAPFIYSVLIDDNLNLYLFTVGKNLFILTLQGEKYTLKGAYVLENPNGSGRRERPSIIDDYLYVVYENNSNVLAYDLSDFIKL